MEGGNHLLGPFPILQFSRNSSRNLWGQFQKLEKLPPRKFRRFTQSKSEAKQTLKSDVIGWAKASRALIGRDAPQPTLARGPCSKTLFCFLRKESSILRCGFWTEYFYSFPY